MARDPLAPNERSVAVGEDVTPAERTLSGRQPPKNAEELRELVRWMSGLSREELLLLTNAEYGFQKSELIQMLQLLDGDWVIDELGRLATGATDELLRATLTVGLFGGFLPSRVGDPRLLTAAREALPLFVSGASDPFGAAKSLTMGAHVACLRQNQNLGDLLLPYLAESDNPGLLAQGYLFVGSRGGAEATLTDALIRHPNEAGRFGALEGLRQAATAGRISADDITRLGSEALAAEASPRNRLLLVEMIGSTGGEAGIAALTDIVRAGRSDLLESAASMLALESDPEHAFETISSALKDPSVSEEDRSALYQALGAIDSPETAERLLGVVNDWGRSEAERLDGLRGLWNRPVDDELAGELRSILDSDAPPAMRAESLKMLALNSESPPSLDVLTLAATDDDAAVRREAVLLGALQAGPDTRGWLEERLLNDRSPDVKAAALGAMVMQAHYAGGGEAALDHLARARKMTDDPKVLELISQGESMARGYDPRRVELQLREDAKMYGTISKYVSGPAQLDMQRRARYLEKMVEALGTSQRR